MKKSPANMEIILPQFVLKASLMKSLNKSFSFRYSEMRSMRAMIKLPIINNNGKTVHSVIKKRKYPTAAAMIEIRFNILISFIIDFLCIVFLYHKTFNM